MACWRRFDSWPPGISWWYTRPVGPGSPDSNGRYTWRTASQYGSRSDTFCSERPVSRSVWARAATSDDADGWLVVPAMGADATSTASTPAADAASRVASWPPGVSCVCRCTGRSKRSRKAVTSFAAAEGRSRPGHVLDGEHVRAGLDDLVGQSQVVVERVQVFGGVEQVAGVADGHLGDGAALGEHGLDGRPHLVDVVQRVEDAEDVDAGGRGLGDEGLGHARRVRRVADGVASAQQHLEVDVRQRLAQGRQALPRVLAEEAQGDVVGGASPGLDREQLGGEPGDVGRDGREVAGAHAGGEQRLVGVAEGGVGDGQRGLGAECRCEALRAELEQSLPRSGRCRLRQVELRQLVDGGDGGRSRAVRLVDGDVGQPVEDLRSAVLRDATAQEFRALVDEGRAQVAGDERRVLEHPLQEGDVGRDAADAELGQCATGTRDGRGEVASARRHLREHRVEVRADVGTGVDGSTVETDAGSTRGAVGRDLAGVRPESGRRVLRRDAALQRRSAQLDVLLVQAEVGEALPRRDADLRLHEVDIRHLLGDGVLDLDARVHLDEDVLAGTLPAVSSRNSTVPALT